MKQFVLVFMVLCAIETAYGQPIWNFQELRPNGQTIRQDSSSLNIGIDISSLVFIEFNRNQIQQKLIGESLKSSKLDSILKTIRMLQALSKHGLNNLPKLSEELKNLDTAKNVNDRQRIILNAWKNITPFTLGIIEIAEQDKELRALLNTTLEESPGDWITSCKNILLATGIYADKLQTRLDEMLTEDGIYIQMAATLYGIKGNKVPLHFEGFDDFIPPEYYDPYELKLVTTDEQQKELKIIESISDLINKKDISVLFQAFRNRLKDKIAIPLINDFEKSLKELEDQTYSVLQQEFNIEGLNNKLNNLRNSIISTHQNITGFKEKYTQVLTGSQAEVLTGLLKDLNNLTSDIQRLINQFKDVAAFIGEKLSTAPGSIKIVLLTLQTNLRAEKLEKIENLKSGFDELAIEITGYRTIHEINKLTIEFTDKVKKLSLLDLPQSTVMDIKNNAGFREEGDNIILEMRGGKPNGEPINLGKQYFTLMMTQPHIVTNVGLIFVSQINSDSEGKFTATPGSSILFKFGTKGKSVFYRKFLDFGLGLSIATLNFSEAKDFEIGIGFIGTVFKDYIQSGIGYNLNAGGWYYLFGFKIPFLNREFEL